MRTRAGNTIALSLTAAAVACVDFVEPDLAERGAPAVLQLEVRIAGDSANVQGRLSPGIDEDGVLREPGAAPLRVAGRAVTPAAVAETGTRTYDAVFRLDAGATDGGVRIEAPVVLDVDAPAPVVHWPTVRRAGPDTVRTDAMGRVVLRPIVIGPAEPEPELRQWSLRLEGDDAAVTITATGLPPDSIVVPPEWLPADGDGEIAARLTLFLSARVEPAPGDYLALITLDTRAGWTILPAAMRPP